MLGKCIFVTAYRRGSLKFNKIFCENIFVSPIKMEFIFPSFIKKKSCNKPFIFLHMTLVYQRIVSSKTQKISEHMVSSYKTLYFHVVF